MKNKRNSQRDDYRLLKNKLLIAAITSRVHTKAKLPTHTAVSNYEGLDKDSVILLEQIRTIDKQRFFGLYD